MYRKIGFKLIVSISMLIFICFMVIVMANIPLDLDFAEVEGKIISNLNKEIYKEDIWNSIKLLTSGKFLKHKVLGKSGDVGEIIKIAMGRSMRIFFMATILSLIIGIPKGIFDSRRKKKQSTFKLLQTLIPLSVPDVLTISLVQLAALYLYTNEISILGMKPIMHIGYEHWSQSIYPTIALALVPAAYIARITASSIEVVYDRDYILAARGKGASESRIILNHIMRNIITDLIGSFPTIASIMFSSLFIVERIFYFPGLAFEMLNIYSRPAADGSSTVAFLGLAVILAIVYFALYTILDITRQVLIPRLKN
ncbi:ABC transporter permease [Tissierella pigra]|uniref:ABC transporter permease n=1 Tax=Tissierella pigra TaxID=2607614 RepID=A0A6N7Y152_9FIRM|nr:ABC transporter permease [Tissierella pigra]MBU5427266.1 ABC transporter permease [Tissierella pigra]MSU02574.1 ABC transporter permease [Tissierella pigra]